VTQFLEEQKLEQFHGLEHVAIDTITRRRNRQDQIRRDKNPRRNESCLTAEGVVSSKDRKVCGWSFLEWKQ